MAGPLLIHTEGAGLYIQMKDHNWKFQHLPTKRLMKKLWKDLSKDPTPQWNDVPRTPETTAALREAKRIWALHQKDLKKHGTGRDDGKTFDTSPDDVYLLPKGSAVKLDRNGSYSGTSGEWISLKNPKYKGNVNIHGLKIGDESGPKKFTLKQHRTLFPNFYAPVGDAKIVKPSLKNVVLKKPGDIAKLDNGTYVVLDQDNKKVPIPPSNTMYYKQVEKAYNSKLPFKLETEDSQSIKTNNTSYVKPLENQIIEKSNTSVPESVIEEERLRNKGQAKNVNNAINTRLAESTGKTDLSITGSYTAKHPQVGSLMINPGGLVGRNADVRRSNWGSTSLSIAQEDFMGIKKGEQLGVLTNHQRNLYDREVLGLKV